MRFLSDETQKLLKELANRKPLQVPNIYHHLPHLLNNEGSLHPAVQVGLGRTGGEKHIYARSTFSTAVTSLINEAFSSEYTCYTNNIKPPEILITPGTESSLNKFSVGDLFTTSIPSGLSFA